MRDADGAFRPNDEPATLGQLDRELRHARELLDERRDTDRLSLDRQANEFARRLVELNLRLDERTRTTHWQMAVLVLIGLLSLATVLLRHLP